ncbi:MAG TPA: GGDEF domain-containing protein, partial [Xanthobacteraceae bacterium]|nr:GGDEF domain-containing protein [Xanthobacteraceae bacterium]
MSLSGPIVVVADENSAVREALAQGGNLPCRHATRAQAAGAIAKAKPSAVILAGAEPDPDYALAQRCADAVDACDGSIIPILAVTQEDVPAYPLALPIAADEVARRLVPRLRAALRVRALHATVLRRIETLTDPADVPDTVDYDPIEDATVLVAGRGRNYPALTVAIGERMGLIGALAVETARSYLNAREVDGIVIGDGFNRAVVDDFLNELGADPRWRDLPVIAPRGSAIDAERLPNAEQFSGDPEAVAARIVPFARAPLLRHAAEPAREPRRGAHHQPAAARKRHRL